MVHSSFWRLPDVQGVILRVACSCYAYKEAFVLACHESGVREKFGEVSCRVEETDQLQLAVGTTRGSAQDVRHDLVVHLVEERRDHQVPPVSHRTETLLDLVS